MKSYTSEELQEMLKTEDGEVDVCDHLARLQGWDLEEIWSDEPAEGEFFRHLVEARWLDGLTYVTEQGVDYLPTENSDLGRDQIWNLMRKYKFTTADVNDETGVLLNGNYNTYLQLDIYIQPQHQVVVIIIEYLQGLRNEN